MNAVQTYFNNLLNIINLPHLDLTQSVAERVVIDSVRFTGDKFSPGSSTVLHF